MDEQKRTRKNLWMFPLGTVGRDMIYTLFTNFILTYILFTRSLTGSAAFRSHGYYGGRPGVRRAERSHHGQHH